MPLVVALATNLFGEQVVDVVRKLLVELGRRRLISIISAEDIFGNAVVNFGVVDSVVEETTTTTTLSEALLLVVVAILLSLHG